MNNITETTKNAEGMNISRILPIGIHFIMIGLFNAVIITPIIFKLMPEKLFGIWINVVLGICVIGVVLLFTTDTYILSILSIVTGVSIGIYATIYDLLPLSMELGALMWILCLGGFVGLMHGHFDKMERMVKSMKRV